MSLFFLAGMVNVLSEICSFFLVGEFQSLIIFNNESFLSISLAALVVRVALRLSHHQPLLRKIRPEQSPAE